MLVINSYRNLLAPLAFSVNILNMLPRGLSNVDKQSLVIDIKIRSIV